LKLKVKKQNPLPEVNSRTRQPSNWNLF